MDYKERLEATQKELTYLVKLNALMNDFNRCLEENLRFRKFFIEYFNMIPSDREKERFVLLLEEFGALEWEKFGIKRYGNKERIDT